MDASRHSTWLPFLSISRHLYKLYYYLFKIFLPFWLAKITRIIHQNQLLLTKFGRISPYWTDDVKSAAKLQIIEPLTKKTWGQVWVVFEVSNGRTFYSFHSELWSNKHGKNSKKRTRQMTSDIGVYLQTWTALYLLNFLIKMHYRYELNIDRGKYVLTCF